MGDASEDTWGLFADREAIEKQMTEQIRANVLEFHGVSIPTPDAAADAFSKQQSPES